MIRRVKEPPKDSFDAVLSLEGGTIGYMVIEQ
jgi:hypothetical protein